MALPLDVGLRPARRTDLDAIVAIVLRSTATFASWAPPSWKPPLAELERAYWWGRLPGDHSRRSLVAVGGDEAIVGVVSWAQAVEPRGPLVPVPGLAHLSALFVVPERWRQGIASALLAATEAEMREAGYARAELWTPRDGPAAGFYAARGWRPDGTEEHSASLGLVGSRYAKEL